MKKYLIIWWLLGLKSARVSFQSRMGASFLILGKIFRFMMFLFFIILIASRTKTIVGYDLWQVIIFFATFNLVDNLAQFFLREVYRFRSYIVSGDFDFFLLKPLSPLFRSLFGGSDVLDIPILIMSVLLLFQAIGHLGGITFANTIFYCLLLANSLLIALAFHIGVLGICILTTEIDNTLWAYRDLTQMGRFPIDIYHEPLRGILTFVIPVGIMMSYPAKALMGLLSWAALSIALCVGILMVIMSLWVWQYSLRQYTSASS